MCKVFAAKKNSKSLSRKYCIRRFRPVYKTFSTLVKKVRINLRLVNCRIMKKFQFLIILKASILTWRVIRGTYERLTKNGGFAAIFARSGSPGESPVGLGWPQNSTKMSGGAKKLLNDTFYNPKQYLFYKICYKLSPWLC